MFLFENVGGKIKIAAVVSQIITAIAGMLALALGALSFLIGLTGDDELIGIGISLAASGIAIIVGSLVPNWCLYGFGTLVENSEAMLEYQIEKDIEAEEKIK